MSLCHCNSCVRTCCCEQCAQRARMADLWLKTLYWREWHRRGGAESSARLFIQATR